MHVWYTKGKHKDAQSEYMIWRSRFVGPIASRSWNSSANIIHVTTAIPQHYANILRWYKHDEQDHIYCAHVNQLSKKLITIWCSTHIVSYYKWMKINKRIFITVVRALQGHNENRTITRLYCRQKHSNVAPS
jgi:hypothetical protein